MIGIAFKIGSTANLKALEPVVDDSRIKRAAGSMKRESISLDACISAFSREELLSGDDQWYCSKCKERRDILKKLELYKLPKILIV